MNWWALFLLWLAGINLRITMLAVPPLIPFIHQDLVLSGKAVGALNGLPVLILGLGALFGSLLLARTGAIRALIAGLAIAAAAGALRGLGPDLSVLFVMTGLMGLGIAIMQPAMPTLVAHWFSNHAGLATAVYVNGLLVGEIIGVATASTVASWLGGWGWAFVVFSLPLAANILALGGALRAGRVKRPGLRGKAAPDGWVPDWRNLTMLVCGLILGGAGSIYFATNAFLPDFLHATGRDHLVDQALTALNVGQLPASLLLLIFADRLVGKRWPLIANGLMSFAVVTALALSTGTTDVIIFSALVGFCASSFLILVLALPPLLAPTHDVHRFSAGVFFIGYTSTFVTPVISGTLWDATERPETAFVPIALMGLVVVLLASTLNISKTRHQPSITEGET